MNSSNSRSFAQNEENVTTILKHCIILLLHGLMTVLYSKTFLFTTLQTNEKAEPEKSILKKSVYHNDKTAVAGVTWPSTVITYIFTFNKSYYFRYLALG
jgi:hypothetical protein